MNNLLPLPCPSPSLLLDLSFCPPPALRLGLRTLEVLSGVSVGALVVEEFWQRGGVERYGLTVVVVGGLIVVGVAVVVTSWWRGGTRSRRMRMRRRRRLRQREQCTGLKGTDRDRNGDKLPDEEDEEVKK